MPPADFVSGTFSERIIQRNVSTLKSASNRRTSWESDFLQSIEDILSVGAHLTVKQYNTLSNLGEKYHE